MKSLILDEHRKEIVDCGCLPIILDLSQQGKVLIDVDLDREQLTEGKKLGEGAFAQVFTGTYKDKPVAIKVFNEMSMAFRLEDFYKEVTMMWYFKHTNPNT